jgi:hypothetical protein
MARFLLIALAVVFGCSDQGGESPAQPSTLIVAKVHWGDQGVPGVKVDLLQTAATLHTDSTGVAVFSVVPGKYVVRAFGINRGGPVQQYIDFDVDVKSGETYVVDIVDCLPCL